MKEYIEILKEIKKNKINLPILKERFKNYTSELLIPETPKTEQTWTFTTVPSKHVTKIEKWIKLHNNILNKISKNLSLNNYMNINQNNRSIEYISKTERSSRLNNLKKYKLKNGLTV